MIVLDSSAVLAWVYQEQGHDVVDGHLDAGQARISAVNWSETLQKIAQAGGDAERLGDMLQGLGLEIVPFDADQARIAARLFPQARSHGLSLGDRACLALARHLAPHVLTADPAWKELPATLEVEIHLLR